MATLTAFIRWLVTLEDVRWFASRIWTQLLDEPEEKWRAARLLTQVLGAGAVSGWVIATFLSAGAGISTLPGATTDPVSIVAREPGVLYNVEAFCKDPATTVGRMPLTDAPAGGVRYVALRGTESVNWADSPEGQNPAAKHYWNDAAGVQQSEDVEVTKDAASCLKGRAQ